MVIVPGNPENTCTTVVHIYKYAEYDTLIALYVWCQSPEDYPNGKMLNRGKEEGRSNKSGLDKVESSPRRQGRSQFVQDCDEMLTGASIGWRE